MLIYQHVLLVIIQLKAVAMVNNSRRVFYCALVTLITIDVVKHLLIILMGPPSISLDAKQYWEMGKLVVGGDPFLLDLRVDYRTPGYAWFLSLFQLGFGKNALLATVIAQHILMWLTSLGTGLFVSRITGSRVAALLAYGLSVACITRAWYANLLLSETLFTFALSVLWCVWYFYLKRPTMQLSAMLGGMLAVSVLIRAVPQLLYVPLIMVMLIQATFEREKLRFALGRAILMIAVYGIVIAPWYARNWVVYDELFLTRLPAVNKWEVCFQDSSGGNLPLPQTDGAKRLLSIVQPEGGDLKDRYCYSIVRRLEAGGLSTEEVDALVTDVCWSGIREYPVRFFWSAFKRFGNFWRCTLNPFPSYGDLSVFYDGQFHWSNESIAELLKPVFNNTASRFLRLNELAFLVMGFSLLCMLLERRTLWRLCGFSIGLIFAYFAAVTAAAEIENYRYRMILEPAVITVIATGLACRFLPKNQQSEAASA